MTTTTIPFLALTTSDLMRRDIITIPQEMSIREAAHAFLQNRISGAPVVDTEGRCVGMLWATDFIPWTEEGGHGAEDVPLSACPYQVKGRLLTGGEVLICTQAEGSCPLQDMRPTTGGRHTTVCVRPTSVINDWHPVTENLTVNAVRCYMTADVVTAGPQTPLPELARTMIDAQIYRVIVVNRQHRPIGIVSITDILAALASPGSQS